MMLSMEYLMLSLVSLCMLSLSVFALLSVKEFSETSSEMLLFESSAVSLANSISEVCALGSGNGRSVELKTSVYVKSEDDVAIISGKGELARPCYCEIEPAGLEGIVFVENKEGIIKIREQ